MKIAYLAGANSIHSIRWVKFFVDEGHDIVWISLAPPIPEAEELVKKTEFYEITPSPLADINGRFALIHLLSTVLTVKKILNKEKRSDLLHIHSAGTYGLVGALTNFHPSILTPWGSDILLGGFIRKLILILIVGQADVYTCDGENTFEKLIGLGSEREKIYLIRFGTDVEKFKPKTPKPLSKNIRIISLRSLVPIYDIETLVRASEIVVRSAPNTEFVLAGDGEDREKLENLAKDLGIGENIKFLGRVNNEELPALLQSADIYVSTALSDSGLSASTAEAMTTGLPVIVTNTGDNKDWVDREFIIPVRSPERLAERITALIKNPALRKNQSLRNAEIIKERNNYYVEMKKVAKIYEKVIENNKETGR